MMIVRCGGCDAPIRDRFLMKVLDKMWHSCCVVCCVCRIPLSDKCFSREGRLFCREDFLRIFGTKCAGCDQVIMSHDLVRRARDRIYHVACFVCAVCKRQLTTGEQLYVVSDYHLLCGRDYFQLAEEEQALEGEGGDIADDQSGKGFIDESLSSKMASDGGHVEMWAKMEESHYDVKHCDLQVSKAVKSEEIGDDDYEEALSVSGEDSPPSSPGNSIDPRHVNDVCSRVAHGDLVKVKDVEQGLVSEMMGSMDGQVEGQTNNVGKRRGPRTTIKAKQLETLKNAFANTPKPTRHIREQLAQETGLNMRVIQVWFQNRRSKERRMKQFNAQGLRRNFFRNPRRIQRVPLIGESHPQLLMRDFFMKGGDVTGEFMTLSHPCAGIQGCYPTHADSSELYDPHRMYGGAEVLYPDFYSSIGMNHVAQSANQMQGMVHPLTNQRAATQSTSSLVSANRVPNLELTSEPIATNHYPMANCDLQNLSEPVIMSHVPAIDQSIVDSDSSELEADQSEQGPSGQSFVMPQCFGSYSNELSNHSAPPSVKSQSLSPAMTSLSLLSSLVPSSSLSSSASFASFDQVYSQQRDISVHSVSHKPIVIKPSVADSCRSNNYSIFRNKSEK